MNLSNISPTALFIDHCLDFNQASHNSALIAINAHSVLRVIRRSEDYELLCNTLTTSVDTGLADLGELDLYSLRARMITPTSFQITLDIARVKLVLNLVFTEDSAILKELRKANPSKEATELLIGHLTGFFDHYLGADKLRSLFKRFDESLIKQEPGLEYYGSVNGRTIRSALRRIGNKVEVSAVNIEISVLDFIAHSRKITPTVRTYHLPNAQYEERIV